MNFAFDDDQAALLDAVARLADRHGESRLDGAARFDHRPALVADLEAAGFHETLHTAGLGAVAAIGAVLSLARLPTTAAFAASFLVRPALGAIAGGHCAVLADGRGRAARFLGDAAHAVVLEVDAAWHAALGAGDARPVESVFACPLGVLARPEASGWRRLDADPARLAALWTLGIAAETVGSLAAGLDAVVAHLRDRRQFGRPLGAFQAIQHRLAETATRLEGGRWLVLEAADALDRGAAGAAAAVAVAAGHAQALVPRATDDLHQFMGAMGLTLEHPLHRFTYRARRLQAEAGGAAARWREVAARAWPEAA